MADQAAEPAAGPVAVPADRRGRRRQETIEEVVATALDVMAEHGAGGLSLGEVARRMGIRPPSLYQYFPSKNAVYDRVFADGWQGVNAALAPYLERLADTDDPRATFAAATTAFVRWSVEHPVHAQLMFWRPVPGFRPSPEAYGHAVEATGRLRAALDHLVARGVLDPAAATDAGVRLNSALVSGIVSQHLANEPGASFERGGFTALVPVVTDLFFHRYRPGGGDDHDDSTVRGRTGADAAPARSRAAGRPGAGLRRRAASTRRR